MGQSLGLFLTIGVRFTLRLCINIRKSLWVTALDFNLSVWLSRHSKQPRRAEELVREGGVLTLSPV